MLNPELVWDRQVRGNLKLCRATVPSTYETEKAPTPPPAAPTETTTDVETFQFQAEVSKVMNIIINSLYSNRDVFLRELISNAADACDKKRFLSITDELNRDVDYRVRVRTDKEAKTLTVEDTGVGMTKDELINNLGSIAHSGTAKFMEALGSGKADINLIGQFGVGFYSGFLVADRVTVVTRSAQGQNPSQWRWESTAGGSYTIAKDEGDPLEGRSGTKLVLHLKDDAEEYLEGSKMKELCNKYSEFISFPIEVWTEQTKYEQVPDEDADKKKEEDDESGGADSKDQEPKMKTVSKTEWGWEHMNKMKPIWMRNPKDVEDSEYKEFYKSTFKAWDDMLCKTHFSLEGQVDFRALLYIPSVLPYGMTRNMFDESERNVRLYVKRVFINDKFEELLPRWLIFVRGIVDSEDLPLNVGREILQKSRILNIISKRLVRKSIDMIKDLKGSDDPKNWNTFWGQFGKYIKVGIVEDEKNRDELAQLVQFPSSRASSEDGGSDGLTNLKDYVSNMKEGQKSIYFIVADSKVAASTSPLLEKAKKLGYEVLFMLDPLDELCAQSLESYEGKTLVDLAKESSSLETPEEYKQKVKQSAEASKEFREWLKDALGTKVSKVEVSERLVDSPAALVQGTYGMSPTMKRYMSAQGVSSSSGMFGSGLGAAPVLEINIDHPIIKSLSTKQHQSSSLSSDEEGILKDEVYLLYNVAALAGGFDIEEASSFAKSITRIMMKDLPMDAEQVVSPKEEGETLSSSASNVGSSDDDSPAVEAEVV